MVSAANTTLAVTSATAKANQPKRSMAKFSLRVGLRLSCREAAPTASFEDARWRAAGAWRPNSILGDQPPQKLPPPRSRNVTEITAFLLQASSQEVADRNKFRHLLNRPVS